MKTNDQNSNGDIPVTAADVDHYNTRGVVLLRNTLASDWINLIRHGIKQDLAKPGPLSREWGRGECHDRFFYDTVCWPRIREFREFIFNSPAAAMAAQLMGSREVRIVNDALFYRSAGTQTPSPFHQDVPYLPVEGRQICSIWIPLLPVEKSSSL